MIFCTYLYSWRLWMFLQISYLHGIPVKQHLHVTRDFISVDMSIVGIAKHFGHTLLASDDDVTTVGIVIEDIKIITVVG